MQNNRSKRIGKKLDALGSAGKSGGFRDICHRMRKNRTAMIGLAIFAIFLFMAIFANVLVDYDADVIAQHSDQRLEAPSAAHWFGTDAYGRDILARVIFGARTTLAIALCATGAATVMGALLGSISGYYGGKIDSAIMRVVDTIMCLPPMLFSLSIVAALGSGLWNLALAVSITYTPYFVRVIRASILTVVNTDYIEAARACGSRDSRIILRHVLPNAIGPVIVEATMSIAQIIMLAASLSFIGLGVQPPMPEWGAMLSDGREYIRYSIYMVIFPGMAIVLSALALNLLGDGLRDALDPRLKN